ncbi:MAG: LamG domain-containing protein [Candidatus Methanomethylicia archaeon]
MAKPASRVLKAHGLHFNGIDQYASVPSFTFPQVFTVVLTVKAYPRVVTSFEWAFIHSYPGVWYGTVSLTVEPNFSTIFRIRGTDGAERQLGTPPIYDEGVFTQVAVQHDGSRMRVFKNGVLVKESSVSVLPPLRTDELWLFRHGGGSMHINMVASSFLIYNRALSDAEIKAIYERGELIKDGLVLCLDFSEGGGNIAYDKSGYNNNGTIYGGARWVIKKSLRVLPKAR